MATKVLTDVGHFDVMDYSVTKFYGKDIYKPYKEYGTKAYISALEEAIKDIESPPSYILVFDNKKYTCKLFVNQKEVKPKNPGELQKKIDKYKRMKFKENTKEEDSNEG